MREMCSILPESKFPPIRYCHRTPKANPADAAEKVQLTGRRATFKSKFTKIHKNMSTIGLVQRQTSGIFRTTEAHPILPFRCFYALCHNLKILKKRIKDKNLKKANRRWRLFKRESKITIWKKRIKDKDLKKKKRIKYGQLYFSKAPNSISACISRF